MQLTDLPEGYTAVPVDEGEDEESISIEDCIDGIDDNARLASATSPTFGLPSDTSLRFIASRTSILTTPDQGERLISSAREQSALDCLSERMGDIYTRLLPDATTETGLTLTPDPRLSEFGDSSVGFTGNATFSRESAPGPITLSTSLVMIQSEDAVTVLLFGGLFQPVAPETIRSLAATVADRQV